MNTNVDSIGPADVERLRRQRNYFGTFAVVSLLVSIGGSLPHFLAKHQELDRLNKEIVALQEAIVANQNYTRQAQNAITQTQQEIANLTKP
jgi:hypothetical protein